MLEHLHSRSRANGKPSLMWSHSARVRRHEAQAREARLRRGTCRTPTAAVAGVRVGSENLGAVGAGRAVVNVGAGLQRGELQNAEGFYQNTNRR